MSTALKPPGPRGLPFLGSLLPFRKNPLHFLQETYHTYGDGSRMRIGPLTLYLFAQPDAVESVFHRGHIFQRSKVIETARPLVGDSIVLSRGEEWRAKRRMTQPIFQPRNLIGFVPVMERLTEQALAQWAQQGDRPLDVRRAAVTLTRDIVTAALFSQDLTGVTSEFYTALDAAFVYLQRRIENPLSFPLWVPSSTNRAFQRGKAYLDGIVDEVIRERLGMSERPHDLLTLLIHAFESEDVPLQIETVRNELMTYFLAGFETTSTTLSWCIYELARNPEIADHIYQEVGQQEVSIDMLRSLQWPLRVINESLRLYPPAWFMDSVAVETTTIGEVTIAQGEHVWTSQYLTHHLPEVWEHPDRFYPEHFTDEQECDRHPFAYYPFGSGTRHCIGQGFALLELQLILVMMVQRFRWSLISSANVGLDPGFVLRPKGEISIQLEQRPVT